MALQKLGEETSLVETVKSSAQIATGCRVSKAGTVACNQCSLKEFYEWVRISHLIMNDCLTILHF